MNHKGVCRTAPATLLFFNMLIWSDKTVCACRYGIIEEIYIYNLKTLGKTKENSSLYIMARLSLEQVISDNKQSSQPYLYNLSFKICV